MLHQVHQAPAECGQAGTRWKLQTLLAACAWLRLRSVAGLWQLLRRLKIHLKRGRAHVHSPDAHYRDKLASVRVSMGACATHPETVFLFGDEFTFYRQPSLAQAYEQAGKRQPLAELGWKSNSVGRVAATLNAWTGQVTYVLGSRLSVPKLVQFYQHVVAAYPTATAFELAEDNWPVHFHPNVLAALQPQTFPWGLHLPANWPTQPSGKVQRPNLPIRLLCLPTYASWTNPIEKLWRWLRQEVLHLHRSADDWDGLKQRVTDFLDQFAHGSQALLRYVGLTQPITLYQALFAN